MLLHRRMMMTFKEIHVWYVYVHVVFHLLPFIYFGYFFIHFPNNSLINTARITQ